MSGDIALQRAHAYLEDARDTSTDPAARCEALDASRSALLEARRGRGRVQPELLLPIFNDICAAASSDSAYAVRCVVPRIVEDLCLREMKIFVPAATHFLVRSLHDDHVLVAKRAVRALTTLFRKLIGYVVSVGVSENTFPESRLSTWLQMQAKAISLIHAQDEGLRKAATKFAETVVLAFSYSGGPGSPDHFTLDYVLKTGSTCPLLNAAALEEEGVRCVKAVSKLIRSGLEGTLTTLNPDGSSITGLPPLSFMTAISVLSNLIRRRRKLLQFTLPPLLLVVAAITGSTRPPSTGFHSLTEGQKQSIVSVLRFSILALRAYPHTKTGRAGTDVNLAINDLSSYEKNLESRRKELAAVKLAREKQQNVLAATAVASGMPAKLHNRIQQSAPMQQRPRRLDPSQPWPRPPAKDAFVIAQTLSRSMPHKEVVNFIMTRLLLNIPPPSTVPGAIRPRNLQKPSSSADEPSQKRPRRTRFGTRDDGSTEQSSTAPKKVTVRKVAPPVVASKLSSEGVEKLITLCCRRVMNKESEAAISGAGPLRTQLLARLLTTMSRKESLTMQTFCDEVCAFIADASRSRVELALAWMHDLFFQEQFANFKPSESYEETQLLSSSNGSDASSSQEQLQPVKGEDTGILMKNEVFKVEDKPDPIEDTKPNLQTEANEEQTELLTNKTDVEDKHVIQRTETDTAPPAENKADEKGSGSLHSPDSTQEQGDAEGGDQQIEENGSEEKKDRLAGSSDDELELEEHEPLEAGAAYERVFARLLMKMTEKPDIPPDMFSRMVTEAPILPSSILKTLDELCRDASSTKLGLQTLQNTVVERCGEDRRKCMTLLLDYTYDSDEVLRGPAIRLVANKIFVECGDEIARIVEEHAIEVLDKAVAGVAKASTTENIDILERSSLLLTALCGQKHQLLTSVVASYAKAPREGQKVLKQRAKDLAGHLGMSATPILQLIGGSLLPDPSDKSSDSYTSDGVEDLALEVLRALLNKFGKPTNDLVAAACRRFEMSKDTSFIIAVLPGLRREALVRYLAAVVDASVRNETGTMQKNTTNEEEGGAIDSAGFREVVSSLMNARPPALSPAELLVELHKIKPTVEVGSAVRGCFEVKNVYKQADIAQGLQQLMEMTVIPDLFMRTVHLARIFHPELEKYLTGSVLKRLIEKKVWTNGLLWEGFLRYCAEVKEKSLKLLLSLPAAQLEDALEKQPVLTSVFKDLVSNPKNVKKIQAKHKKVIGAAIKKIAKTKR